MFGSSEKQRLKDEVAALKAHLAEVQMSRHIDYVYQEINALKARVDRIESEL